MEPANFNNMQNMNPFNAEQGVVNKDENFLNKAVNSLFQGFNRPMEAFTSGNSLQIAIMLPFIGLMPTAIAIETLRNAHDEQFHNGTDQLKLQHRGPTFEEASCTSCDDWNELLK